MQILKFAVHQEAVQEKSFSTFYLAFADALQNNAKTNEDRCLDRDSNHTRSTDAAMAYKVT